MADYNAGTQTFTGTPPVDNTGVDIVIPVTVTDVHGATFVASVTIHPVNPGPVANLDNSSTAQGFKVAVDLLGNDSDPDGDAISILGTPTLADPSNGTLAFNAISGLWEFQPDAAFIGEATINYTIIDADGAKADGTHKVAVAANAPPVLTDPDVGPKTPYIDLTNSANLIVPAVDGTALTLPLSPYFADPNGDTMTITIDPAVVSGLPAWLTYNAGTHTFSGTPPVDNTGVDIVIPVTVTDEHGATFVASVTIHPVNPGPVANLDNSSTVQGFKVAVDLLGNDSDPDGDAISIFGTPTLADPSNGTLAFNAISGLWEFQPDAAFIGEATINYTIIDADGAKTDGTHKVAVAANAPPVLTDPDVGPKTPYIDLTNSANLIVPAEDGTELTLPLSPYFADPNGDTMTITIDPAVVSGLPAWLTYNAGTHTFTGTPPVDNTGVDIVIPVTVTDVHGASFVASVTIHPVNPGPVTVMDTTAMVQGTSGIVNLIGTDSDPDGDLPLTIVGTPVVTSGSGSLSLVGGNWVFTPDPAFTGTAMINYVVTDSDGAQSIGTHMVTVGAFAAVDDSYTTAYLTLLHGNAAALDTFPPGSVFSAPASTGHGSVVMNPNGTYTYTPAAGFAGTDSFTYTITDPAGNKVTATEHIIVSPPVLTAVNDDYTTAFRAQLIGNAATADTFATGSVFTVTSSVPAASGTLVMQPNGNYTFTPATNFSGTLTFTYQIKDPVGQIATAVDTIIVSKPQLVAVNDMHTSSFGKVLNSTVAGNDTFAVGSVFTVASKPTMGTLTMQPNGTFKYVPKPGFTGTDTFTYAITDPTGQTITATETITIEARPPLHRCLTTFGRITGFVRRR